MLFAFNCLYIFVDDRMIVLFALSLIQLKLEIGFHSSSGVFLISVLIYEVFRVGIKEAGILIFYRILNAEFGGK